MARLDVRLARIEQALGDLVPAPQAGPGASLDLGGVQQSLATLEKQISRAGREQLKMHALFEAQIEQQRAALEALRAADERRERDATLLREQQPRTQQAARLDIVRATLPALDGLDEALRAGADLLAQATTPQRRRGLFGRLRRPIPPSAGEQVLRDNMHAWLDGLRFVRQRLLDVLAAEGVRPMGAAGQPFDPHHHIALDVVPATDQPPGTVVTTLREGYLAGDRILRHADVVVAGETTETEPARGIRK